MQEHWKDAGNPDSENPGKQIKETVQTVEELSYKAHEDNKEIWHAFQKTLNSIVYIKEKLDQGDWNPSKVPARSLPAYYEDVTFYLGILYLVQQATGSWCAVFPKNILPPSCVGKFNINLKALNAYNEYIENSDILKWVDTNNKKCELEKAIEELEPLALKYKGYDCISSLVTHLQKGLREFPPENKADEDRILCLLKKIRINLQHPPGWLNTLHIISHAFSTGLLMCSATDGSLSKIFAECFKFNDPVPRLKKLKANVKQDIITHHNNAFDSTELSTNAAGALSQLQAHIKTTQKRVQSPEGKNFKIAWNEHKDEFLDLFGNLIRQKSISIPNHKDLSQTINLIANIFVVPKVRGKGTLSVDSLVTYLHEISGIEKP
jgi:hypothetical protein